MVEKKSRKRRAPSTTVSTSSTRKDTTSTRVNTADGFIQSDQRLPASPPSHDTSTNVTHANSGGLMAFVRAGCRNALDMLFGSEQRILNAPCYAGAAINNHSSISIKRSTKRRRVSESISSPSSQKQQQQQSTSQSDQVVPEVTANSDSIGIEIDSFAQCPSPSKCTCANNLWIKGGIGPETMLRTAEELRTKINTLYAMAVDRNTNNVDYSSLVHSNDFHEYLASARKLRYFDPMLLDEQHRKAFFLNVYNSLMIHAITVMARPRSMFERISMFNSASYNIGGRPYSLNAIEHGVLRCNRRGGGPIAEIPFQNNDARKLCALSSVDPRIHFALNCGARSCPAVRFYEASSLDKTLDLATRCYLEDLEVNYEDRIITVPKILQWYKVDFCDDGNMNSVLRWTLPYLSNEKRSNLEDLLKEKEEDDITFKIAQADYDWSINDKQ